MKKRLVILGGLLVAIHTFGQDTNRAEAGCDCPSCLAKAAGETLPFTLSALQGLNEDFESAPPPAQKTKDAVQLDHETAEHDEHSAVPHDHDGDGKPDHEVHGDVHEDHEGHDHGDHADAEGVELSEEMIQKVGIQIHEAEGGTIAKASIFPAEIKLNRDRAAAVSPRYDSVVRQVFAEIGDAVKKDDVLATLENRETMAVYTIAAPLDGTIISKNLAVGETASADKVLFEVADLSSVWADINIFPKYQHLLRKGMPVKFVAPDGHTARGTVKYISPILSHETRTFTARCILEGSDEDFTPGAFVRAQINIETADASVVVEREAIQVLEGETVIFVPGDHGFQALEVELGLADEHNVEIKSGLKPGAPYVAVGAFALKAQMVTSGMDPHAGHGH